MDRFGFGTKTKVSKEEAKALVETSKEYLERDGYLPNDFADKLLSLDAADYAGFFGGEDFAEEILKLQELANINNDMFYGIR
tara:strand:- start:351 stop:596 length:246 start_codon:yes stop_codon:yes gene_type:complete